MTKVIVYLLTDDPESSHCLILNDLFRSGRSPAQAKASASESDLYHVKFVKRKLPENEHTAKYSEEKLTQLDESHRFFWALQDSVNHPNDYILIIKDTSVTHANGKTIESIIRKIIESTKFHLCYLCKWMDRCDIYSDKKEIHKSAILAKTQAPHGIQTILISPEGRDILLGEKPMKNGKFILKGAFENENMSPVLTEFILKGYIDATVVVPNLFDFNIAKATKNSDFMKTIECLPPPMNKAEESITTSGKISSYVVLVLLILLIALGLFMLVGKS